MSKLGPQEPVSGWFPPPLPEETGDRLLVQSHASPLRLLLEHSITCSTKTKGSNVKHVLKLYWNTLFVLTNSRPYSPTWLWNWWINVFSPDIRHKTFALITNWFLPSCEAEMMLTLTCTNSLSELERAEPLWLSNLRGVLQAWLIFLPLLVNNLSRSPQVVFSSAEVFGPSFVVLWGTRGGGFTHL